VRKNLFLNTGDKLTEHKGKQNVN